VHFIFDDFKIDIGGMSAFKRIILGIAIVTKTTKYRESLEEKIGLPLNIK